MVVASSLLNRLWTGNASGSGSGRKKVMQDSDGDDGSGNEMVTKKVRRRRRRAADEDIQRSSVSTEGYYPGMVNLSGTLCYMNSVLQAFASITSLVKHLEKIVELAVEADVPTLVTDALLDVIRDLNTPQSRPPPALRPHNLLIPLQELPAVRRLLSTREQQDAHELFVVLAEAISNEAVKVAAEIARVRGLGEVLSLQGYVSGKNDSKTALGKGSSSRAKARVKRGDVEGAKRRDKIRGIAQPWEGLMARRRVCQTCGWSENVRMDTLGGMELPIPLHGDVTVDACIAEYLSPEHLSEVTCEMCSLRQTINHYRLEVERLSSPPSHTKPKKIDQKASVESGSFSALEGIPTAFPNGILGEHSSESDKLSNSRKKRARDARRAENRLQQMLESGTVSHFGENLVPPSPLTEGSAEIPVKWQTARTSSIRQGIITRPPQSLRLLFIRSEFTPYGAVLKKTARVNFPMYLDLTRFTANGVWEERGNGNVASMLAKNVKDGLGDPTGAGAGADEAGRSIEPIQRRVLYRLESMILHYGYTHSSGHFICIRRKPSPPPVSSWKKEEGSGPFRPSTVNKSCPDGCQCEPCAYFGQVRDHQDGPSGLGPGIGKGWLRISDADVDEVGEEALYEARGAVFMLFYEKVGEYQGPKTTKALEQQQSDVKAKGGESISDRVDQKDGAPADDRQDPPLQSPSTSFPRHRKREGVEEHDLNQASQLI
ncbi:ubiquitin carboxyl-terminal hydrolase 1 [Kwoniella heveanensis CBS 569]|nr:ubiquitin carboxyl-terminal hydrolase 1 [Kwoniella heveanensis CBS 569]